MITEDELPTGWGGVLAFAREAAQRSKECLHSGKEMDLERAHVFRGMVIACHQAAVLVLGAEDTITGLLDSEVGALDMAWIQKRKLENELKRREAAWEEKNADRPSAE